jgi:hypothetical protein
LRRADECDPFRVEEKEDANQPSEGIALRCAPGEPSTAAFAHLSQSEKVERFRKRSGITSLSDETCQRLDLHLSRRSDGIHRVVVPLRPAEADALQGTDRPGDWVPGPIPEPIWKATVMMGDTRQPPDKFIPVYTNQLKYVYREVGANFHIYILDTTDSKEPILYYVYYNLQ